MHRKHKQGLLDCFQRYMLALVALSREAADIADAIRRMLR